MDKADKEKITKNLSILSQETKWSRDLERFLLENKVFSKKLLDPIAVSNVFCPH